MERGSCAGRVERGAQEVEVEIIRTHKQTLRYTHKQKLCSTHKMETEAPRRMSNHTHKQKLYQVHKRERRGTRRWRTENPLLAASV